MGFMDKLKNIFFEEEEDEEIEDTLPPKKEKKEEVVAKKVEVPKTKKEEIKEDEKFTEIKEIPKKVEPKIENKINTDLIFDDEDFIMDTKPKIKKTEKIKEPKIENTYKVREKELYKEEKKEPKKEYVNTIYKKQEELKTFTPSPIISPIYGILDKNYKKEEVKENKEIRISSRPIKIDLDSVRNKAFGDLEYDLFDSRDDEEKEEAKEEKKDKKDVRKVYDIPKDKPMIDKVTLAEADEYFNDLGLAYNTDYKDLSKDINDGKVKEKENKDKLEDNLFDLIESMYDKED